MGISSGNIYESENYANGIIINKILHDLHKYVPFVGEGQEREYCSLQPIVGDQLTVERAVNCHMSLCNGFTQEERLDGLHKIFERCVFNQVYTYLNEYSLLSIYQARFRPKNSTLSALYKCVTIGTQI
jgi:hypothetical protein